MLTITCDRCGTELAQQGGLLFSPPSNSAVLKFHLCGECYEQVKDFIEDPNGGW